MITNDSKLQTELVREAIVTWFLELQNQDHFFYVGTQTYSEYHNFKRVRKTCMRLDTCNGIPNGSICLVFTEMGIFGDRVHCHFCIATPISIDERILEIKARLAVDGHAKFEPILRGEAAITYVTKYMTKELTEDMWHAFAKGSYSPIVTWGNV